MNDNVPCRVSADLRAHESAQNHAEPLQFDLHDDALMHDLLGNDRLAKPVQALLLTLEQIEMTRASFGVDHFKALEAILPELRDLRAAVLAEFRDL